MVTLVDLKDLRKIVNEGQQEERQVLEKLLAEEGRSGVISFCSGALDKRAYFTVNSKGKINRKDYNYAISSAVFTGDDEKFLDFVSEKIDFREIIKIEKIGRMTNASDSDLEKNVYKLLAKGEIKFLLKPLKEICMRNQDRLFEILFDFALMDNINFKKPLVVYSMKKYFEKFGYSDEVLYLVVAYLGKMRADFYAYENQEEGMEISKEQLKKEFYSNIDSFRNQKGLAILSYLIALTEYSYEDENIYCNIVKKEMDSILNNNREVDNFSEIEKEIFVNLSKEGM